MLGPRVAVRGMAQARVWRRKEGQQELGIALKETFCIGW